MALTIEDSFYRVIEDPHNLFKGGAFRKVDFVISLYGYVWAENTIVVNEDGEKGRVVYDDGTPLLIIEGVRFYANNDGRISPSPKYKRVR